MRDGNKPLRLDIDLNVKIEKYVSECLASMSEYTRISKNEIVNTALRRYIATHKDYLPDKKISAVKE